MKATRVLVVVASIFALASGAWGQSISGKNPVIRGDKVGWPLAFMFNGSGPTIDVGNQPRPEYAHLHRQRLCKVQRAFPSSGQ